MSGFKDHFSGHAAHYSRYRPTYPPELFEWLAGLAPRRELAWDAGTGNGQAARALAAHFSRVVASDASREQIARAAAQPGVEYRIAPAEQSGLEAASVDLATAAQALHWFDLERYWAELARVLRAGGIVAVWTYTLLRIEPDVDALIDAFYRRTVGPYWPPERAMTEDGYRGIAWPFDEIEAPAFTMQARWTLAQLAAYLRTWSAVQRYLRARGEDPVAALEEALRPLWGDPRQRRELRWPLGLRVGSLAP